MSDRPYYHSKICLLMGLPYSGKSTAASHLSKILGAPIVCPDHIRRAVHGQRYAQEAEPLIWPIARIMVRSLFRAGHEWVILDATNTTRERRDEWRSSENWRVYVHEVDCTQFECERRARKAGDEEILPIIKRMAGRYEPLQDDEEPLRLNVRERLQEDMDAEEQ